jgi:hypothetical protein
VWGGLGPQEKNHYPEPSGMLGRQKYQVTVAGSDTLTVMGSAISSRLTTLPARRPWDRCLLYSLRQDDPCEWRLGGWCLMLPGRSEKVARPSVARSTWTPS